jgi:hypothetical protein
LPFNEFHIGVLDRIVAETERDDAGDLELTTRGWAGSACRAWGASVTGQPQLQLPEARQNRAAVRCLVQSNALSDDEAHLAVMAWGGQRRDHGRVVWESIDLLRPILSGLRTSALDRRAGYEALFELTTRTEGRVQSLGPAYYTKLLFFLPPRSAGQIMDQWTAKSMQLLANRGDQPPTIKLSHAGYVSRDNDAEVYSQFCKFIAQLAARYKISEGNAEELIFSGSRQAWRNHVRTHWAYHA